MPLTMRVHTRDHDTGSATTQDFEKSQIAIGNDPRSDIALDDLRVSLHHATIERIGDTYILKDTNSRNGTYLVREDQLADMLVTEGEERPLRNNDEIHIGSYTLRISITTPENLLEITVEQTTVGVWTQGAQTVGLHSQAWMHQGDFYLRTRGAQGLEEKRPKIVRVLGQIFHRVFCTKGGLTGLCFLLVPGITLTVMAGWGWIPTSIGEPGKVAAAHSRFERDCSKCHTGASQGVAEACQGCHKASLHHDNQVPPPSCTLCHAEHRGRQIKLQAVDNQFCTRCHADLSPPKGTSLHFASRIQSFTTDHPEFAIHAGIARVRLSDQGNLHDTAQLKLNHKAHLKPGLMNLEGSETLTCSNCHQVDDKGAYMRPITYGEHCMRCHLLEFDERFPQQVVPHGKQPKDMQTFLRHNFTQRCLERLAQPPAVPQEAGEGALERRRSGPDPREKALEVVRCRDAGVRDAQKRLYTGGKQSICEECHTLQDLPPGSELPTVVRPAIPARWFPHSVFSHQAHALVDRSCEDCHGKARDSTETTDVLLPSIAACQECHSVAGKVRFTCMTCHRYHSAAVSK